ncbi:MAG: group I intron-associated PD-(D/E)XK endonuclease [Candidatus Omnitrophica bacterium]|nr:group I intron-associated PD-(D/E)XK endonuclease [Candidatus Omnitrophota bacterium]
MNTKQKGDIAEQVAVLEALKRGWGVLKPVGDRLPYDLVFDIQGCLVKVQIKAAWFDELRENYVVDNRRTKTNRRMMIRAKYKASDFDFALAFIEKLNVFYVFPLDVFVSYASEIHLVETDKRPRKPKAADYRNAWFLIQEWALRKVTYVESPVKFGEASGNGNPEPSPLPAIRVTERCRDLTAGTLLR